MKRQSFKFLTIAGWPGGTGSQYLMLTAAGMCLHAASVGISYDVSFFQCFVLQTVLLICSYSCLQYGFRSQKCPDWLKSTNIS